MRPSPRNPVVATAFGLVLALAAACKQADPTPAPISPPDVVIVSAGSEPRRVLRYHAPPGTTQKLELSIAVQLTAGDAGGPMPTIQLAVTYAVGAVMPTGQMTLEGTIDAVTPLEAEGSKVPAAALAGPLSTLQGLVIHSVLSPNGRVTGSTIDKGTRTIAPELEAQLQSLVKSFESTMMVLPDEPVGVGAVWRNSRPVEQNGLALKAVNSVSLTAINGDSISYTIDTDIHGADQSVQQEGTTIEVKDIVGSGGGKGTINLATLAVTSELAAELRSLMGAPGDTEPTKMQMSTVQNVRPL